MLNIKEGLYLRGITVKNLRAILDDPENKIRDDDLITVNRVGNLAVLTADWKNTQMYIDLGDETIDWPTKQEKTDD